VRRISAYYSGQPIRIKAPDEALFKWAASTVKNRYRVRTYIELTSERTLIVTDVPARFLDFPLVDPFYWA